LSFVFGIVAGFLTGIIMKGGVFELVGDLIIGVTGAFSRVWLSGLLGTSAGGVLGLLADAIAGSPSLLQVIRLVKKG